jgi:hypothetical protein
MDTKHTPGPWSFEYSNDTGPNDDYFIEFFEVLSKDCKEIARVENEADARLISSAPDLLEALSDVVKFWDSIVPTDCVNDMHIKARAAIAKAVGMYQSTKGN